MQLNLMLEFSSLTRKTNKTKACANNFHVYIVNIGGCQKSIAKPATHVPINARAQSIYRILPFLIRHTPQNPNMRKLHTSRPKRTFFPPTRAQIRISSPGTITYDSHYRRSRPTFAERGSTKRVQTHVFFPPWED